MASGSRPSPATFTTTAGRSFCISAPTAGSKRTSHTSLLRGFIVQVILTKGLEVRYVPVAPVARLRLGRRRS